MTDHTHPAQPSARPQPAYPFPSSDPPQPPYPVSPSAPAQPPYPVSSFGPPPPSIPFSHSKVPYFDSYALTPERLDSMKEHELADILHDLDSEGLSVKLYEGGKDGFSIGVHFVQAGAPGFPETDIFYEFPVSKDSALKYLKKFGDLDAYINRYGTLRGYEGPIPDSMTYSSNLFPECDEVVLFIRSVITRCRWDFLPWDFLRDLFQSWHERNFLAWKCPDWPYVTGRLLDLCCLRAGVCKFGWADIDYYSPLIAPTISMRSPEPLIEEYNLENWKFLAEGCCSELAKQYDPKISKNWIDYLSDDLCLANGLCRLCKCHLPITGDNPLFHESDDEV